MLCLSFPVDNDSFWLVGRCSPTIRSFTKMTFYVFPLMFSFSEQDSVAQASLKVTM